MSKENEKTEAEAQEALGLAILKNYGPMGAGFDLSPAAHAANAATADAEETQAPIEQALETLAAKPIMGEDNVGKDLAALQKKTDEAAKNLTEQEAAKELKKEQKKAAKKAAKKLEQRVYRKLAAIIPNVRQLVKVKKSKKGGA